MEIREDYAIPKRYLINYAIRTQVFRERGNLVTLSN